MEPHYSLVPSGVRRSQNRARRGEAVLEIAFLVPWIYFLFAGAFDVGFYCYGLIATQESARSAAEYTSRNSTTVSDSAGACQYALVQMRALSNVSNLAGCSAAPLVVSAQAVNDADGYASSAVSVTYTSDKLLLIPGLAKQFTITRTVRMMVR